MTFANAYVAGLAMDEHDGGPVAPESWARSEQGSTGWTMLTAPGGLLAAHYVGAIAGPPARGLFAIFGDAAVIESWAGDAMPAREMFRRRGESLAGQMVRGWPVWRVTDDAGSESRRRLDVPLAAGLPSAGSPWAGDVTALHRPALDATLAGHALHTRLEDQPDRDP